MTDFYQLMNWDHGINADAMADVEGPDVSPWENHQASRFIDVGDLVAIPAKSFLKHFYLNRDESTPRFKKCLKMFTPKRLIYGAVKEKEIDYDGQTFFVVDWAVLGLYRNGVLMNGSRDWAYIKLLKVYGYQVSSIQKKGEIPTFQNLYTRLFFDYSHGDGYSLKNLYHTGVPCKYCDKADACMRTTDDRVQNAMLHMYVDITLKKNSHLNNEARRFICCTYFTALNHGVLKRGVRYPVEKCIHAEMKELFPSEKFTEYKDA